MKEFNAIPFRRQMRRSNVRGYFVPHFSIRKNAETCRTGSNQIGVRASLF
jgi:hypothetical protein